MAGVGWVRVIGLAGSWAGDGSYLVLNGGIADDFL